jgi:hypothetical protein
MTQNKQTGKVRSRKLFYRRGIILLVSIIGVGLLYYLVPGKLKKPVVAPPKISLPGKEISTDFNLNTFTQGSEPRLLHEIGICDTLTLKDNNLDEPACSPRFFRFFPLKNNTDFQNGFMLLVRSDVHAFPTRRLLIFQRESNQLVQVNGFNGYLIERRKSKTEYDDIVIRFFERFDKQIYFYHCLFSWDQGKYNYVKCEEINDQKVKVEKVDSVSKVVLGYLSDKKLIF